MMDVNHHQHHRNIVKMNKCELLVLGGYCPVAWYPFPTLPSPPQHHVGSCDVTQRETHIQLSWWHDCCARLSQRELWHTMILQATLINLN